MSTALEAIAARHLGAEVLGLSLVTNIAAGLTAEPLDHAEVIGRPAGRSPDRQPAPLDPAKDMLTPMPGLPVDGSAASSTCGQVSPARPPSRRRP
jgi:hypothetical protein